jgi:hypothetical protein
MIICICLHHNIRDTARQDTKRYAEASRIFFYIACNIDIHPKILSKKGRQHM